MLNVVDLFCGAGGFSQGFKDAGFNILLGIDCEEHKIKVYEKNVCSNILKGDISVLHGYEILKKTEGRKIDILIGSPPCKDFSTCRPNKHSDTFFMNESKLAYHFIRLVIVLKPSWFVMENVNGYFLTLDGEFIQHIFSIAGYNVSLLDLDAAKLGIPQHRQRGFLVGNREKCEFKLNITEKPLVSIREAISDLEDHNYDLIDNGEKIKLRNEYSDYQRLMRENIGTLKNHTFTSHDEEVIKRIASLREGESHKQYNNYKRAFYDKPSRTITTRFDTPSGQGESIHPKYNRSFTPREAARLQSFKDSFEFIGNKEQIREQIGDAVPPLMAQTIAESIMEYYK